MAKNDGWTDRAAWNLAQGRKAEGPGAGIVVTLEKKNGDDLPVWVGAIPSVAVVEEEPTITFQVGDVVYTKVPYSMPLEEAVEKGLCVVEEDPAITYVKAVIDGLREEK